MEFLTTPNEGLIGIIFNKWGIPFIFIEATVFALLFTQILKISFTRKQLIIYVISISFISALSNTLLGKPLSTYFNMIVEVILIMAIFKVKFFKAIIAEFIPAMISAILEVLFSILYVVLFKGNYEEILTIPLVRVPITLLIYLFTYILYRLVKYNKFNIALSENMNKKNKIMLTLNFTFAIIAIGVQIYIIVFYLNELSLLVALMSIISLTSYFAVSIISLLKTVKLEAARKSLEEAKLYNKTLQILHDNLRCFRHDFSNIMQSIDGYISNSDMKGLKKYYTGIKDECNISSNLTLLNPNLINDSALYSLITSKYHLAENLGISFNINISVNFNAISISPYTLTRILGVLIDNAIEAAKDSEEKEIYFEVTKTFRSTSIKKSTISIENTYSNKEVNIDRIREKGYSTKISDEESHGLGLWEVNKILKKSKNLNLYTTKTEKFFRQELEIFDEEN
ncbi:MAG: GHKL domain-containing protein [Clostridia bacterium]|nr:GHKL domain-containing protein [Clostridia bacterium]